MIRNEAMTTNMLVDPISSHRFASKVVAHPSRQSLGQVLAGSGHLIFEGEMLETPLSWHPKGTKH